MNKFYMHTINGKPALYWPGEQICYYNYYGKLTPLAKSLSQIRREQKASHEYRRSYGATVDPKEYGYIRVRTP